MRTIADRPVRWRSATRERDTQPDTPAKSVRHDSDSSVLAFDVGGTYMRAGIYDPASDRVTAVRRRLSPNYLSNSRAAPLPEELMKALAALASEVLEGSRATIVSLAFPAPIDGDGNALAVPTLLGAAARCSLPIAAAAEACWPYARVFVLNDLTAAGFRYAREVQDFCILTVGSGIGHKVFLGGRPQLGPGGRGGEIGHLRLDFDADAPTCDCGGRGHLGALASGRGTLQSAIRTARDSPAAFRRGIAGERCGGDPGRLDSEILVQAFRDRDSWARDIVCGAARRLGQGLAAIHLGVGVETFIIIGGFAMALGEDYRLMLVEAARDSCWDVGQDWATMIRFGAPDDDHALVGGGRHAASSCSSTTRRSSGVA